VAKPQYDRVTREHAGGGWVVHGDQNENGPIDDVLRRPMSTRIFLTSPSLYTCTVIRAMGD